MQLNERIILARKQAGLTQEQLGEALGVSRQAVSKWESGQANPDVGYIIKLCELLELSADWLLTGKSETGTPGVGFCAGCGAAVRPSDRFCPMCGGELGAAEGKNPRRENDYFLFLVGTGDLSWNVAGATARLFAREWAEPDFPWDGSPIDQDKAWDIIREAPMILCSGLTKEQAAEGRALFLDDAHLVEIYRERDMEEDFWDSEEAPSVPPCVLPGSDPVPPTREPLSGGAVFGLVVLGVIVAVLILSLF